LLDCYTSIEKGELVKKEAGAFQLKKAGLTSDLESSLWPTEEGASAVKAVSSGKKKT